MNNLRAAAVQFQHAPGDKSANLATIESFARQAAARQAELIVFPECCVTGYWHLRKLERSALEQLAEPVPTGPTTQRLLELAAELKMTIGAGIIESSEDKLYNSYVVAMSDGSFACHRKLHAFVSPHLTCGDQYTVFDTPHGCRMAVLICYDNNLIENARICALQGAEVLLAPHQTGGCLSGSPHAMGLVSREAWDRREEDPATIASEILGDKGRGWLMRWLPARAHDNGMFLVFSNGVGPDDNEVRTGNAMILDPYGRIVAESRRAADDLVIADLDASLRERCTGVRWIRARRPELYQPLVQATGAEQETREVRFDFLSPGSSTTDGLQP